MVFMFNIFVEGKFLKWDHWLKIYVNVYVIVVDIGKLHSVLHSNWQYMRVLFVHSLNNSALMFIIY